MSERNLQISFEILFKSPTVMGEDAESSKIILTAIGKEDEAKKSVIQHFGLLSAKQAGFLARASSIRGLLRVASEFAVELKAQSLFSKHAVCSFLEVNGKLGTPKCSLPLPSEGEGKIFNELIAGEGWIVFNNEHIKFKNYPCIPCAIFGATGLKSLVRVELERGFAHSIEPYETRFLFFNEIMREGRKKPLFLYTIKPDTTLNLHVSIPRRMEPQKLRAKSCKPQKLAGAVIWLAAQLISSGFLRLGRFKSRGFGVVELKPINGTLDILAQLLDSESSEEQGLTHKASEILEAELKARLVS
jgi:CRISPR/Cas system CSM-associated protein Csm3 (group 7 of RAMP superfamily)